MWRVFRIGLACGSLLGMGCLPSLVPADVAPSGPFRADGGIVVDLGSGGGASASFDENRVVGPNINVSRRADGTWAGTLKGQLISVSANGEHISGSMMSLHVKQTAERINVGGIAGGSNLRISITRKRLEVKTPQYSTTIRRTDSDTFGVGAVQLRGDAALPDPPQPQLALAMLGAF